MALAFLTKTLFGLRATRRSSPGAAAVEFAIIAPLFLLIVLFMVDAGRILYVKSSLLNSSSQGAREAALGATSAQVITTARNAAPGVISMANSTDTQVTVVINTACPAVLTPANVEMAAVTTSITYKWTTPLALLRIFTPAQSRPGTMVLSSSSQWLCAE